MERLNNQYELAVPTFAHHRCETSSLPQGTERQNRLYAARYPCPIPHGLLIHFTRPRNWPYMWCGPCGTVADGSNPIGIYIYTRSYTDNAVAHSSVNKIFSMYPVGLLTILYRIPECIHINTALLLIAALLCYVLYKLTSKKASHGIASLPGLFIFNISPFYYRRFDFLKWGFQMTGHSVFQFRLLRVGLPASQAACLRTLIPFGIPRIVSSSSQANRAARISSMQEVSIYKKASECYQEL
jgi:hypothetical protein